MHIASIAEVENAFATTGHRKRFFARLVKVLGELAAAGCQSVYLDGSYVTGKPRPSDYDLCWDAEGVVAEQLPPVLLNIHNRRKIKDVFRGDVLPYTPSEGGASLLNLFQTDKDTGLAKEIIKINLVAEDVA